MALLTAVLVPLIACRIACSAEAPPPPQARPATKPVEAVYQPITDVPGLPRVLIIGDSVSCGYTLPLRAALTGVANVHRPPQNCGSSAVGLQNLDRWLGDQPWDVIHFNHGLHDLSCEFSPGNNRNAAGDYARPDNGGHHRVAPDEYRTNLTTLVERLRARAPHATLIFATTTPVSADLHHYVKDSELEYNRAAQAVMAAMGVQVNDLWAFAKPRIADIQEPGNPHFTTKGSQVLAAEIAEVIRVALAARQENR
jgi:acyl-CoA thioesterase-1